MPNMTYRGRSAAALDLAVKTLKDNHRALTVEDAVQVQVQIYLAQALVGALFHLAEQVIDQSDKRVMTEA